MQAVDLGRTRDLEERVGRLERSQNTLSTYGAREHIISADKPIADQHLDLRLTTNKTNRFQLRGHYKIPTDATPVAAWVSDWSPRPDILKFEEFSLVAHPDSGEVELVTRPRAGETIDMTFHVQILIREFITIHPR